MFTQEEEEGRIRQKKKNVVRRSLSLSLSLSRVRLVRIDFNRPTLIRYLNIGDMIEYQDQLAIIRKVQKGRNVQVEFVSKTSKSKDFLFLFFSETTSFPPRGTRRRDKTS